MRVVLIAPPQTELRAPKAYMPLSLGYLAATLLDSGIETEILNLSDATNLRKVDIPDADWYGVTCVSATYKPVVELCNIINGKTVVGGVHPTVEPEQTLKDTGADFVITGEGDYVFRDLVSGLIEPKHQIIKGGVVEDLDSLPFPARHLFPYNEVVNFDGILGCDKGIAATSIITARGCPYRCSFCVKSHEMFSRFRYRSAENVAEEVSLLVKDYGVQHIRILDDTFTLIKKRVLDLCSKIKPLDITWACITRCDHIDNEMLYNMKKAGCIEVNTGIETGSKRLLKLMNKNETIETYIKAAEKIRNVGLRFKPFLMYDFPTETRKDREDTLELVRKLKPDKFTLSKFTLLPGSDMWIHPEKYGIPKTHQSYFYPDEKDAGWMSFKEEINRIIEENREK